MPEVEITRPERGQFRVRDWLRSVFGNREEITEAELVRAGERLPFKWTRVFRGINYGPIATLKRLESERYIIWDIGGAGLRRSVVRLGPRFFERAGTEGLETTFGIEFEGNFLHPRGQVRHVNSRYVTVPGWSYQHDPTASFEIDSPVWTDVKKASEDVKEEFQRWTNDNHPVVPFFKSSRYYPQVGGHIHIGLGSLNGSRLTVGKMGKIVPRIYGFLPFLYFMNANGFNKTSYSRRMTERPYSPYLNSFDTGAISSRRLEIYFNSQFKTIEFRTFDSNVPPIHLAVCALLKEVVRKSSEFNQFDLPSVSTMRRNVLKYPPDFKFLLMARDEFEKISDLSLEDLPKSVKEVLVLSFVFLLNPSKFVRHYHYGFSASASRECSFLDAIPEKELRGERVRIAERVKEIVEGAKTLKDLLGRIILTEETYYLMRFQEFNFESLNKYSVDFLTDKTKARVEKMIKEKRTVPNVPKSVTGVVKRTGWFRLRDIDTAALNLISSSVGYSVGAMWSMRERWYVYLRRGEPKCALAIMWSESKVTKVFDFGVETETVMRFVRDRLLLSPEVWEGRTCVELERCG